MPHRIFHGDACFAFFNKIWGIPLRESARSLFGALAALPAMF
jgi:hypothetical protein